MGLNDKKDTSEDDDLTNLTWLQDRNLLKSINDAREEKDFVRFDEEGESLYPSDDDFTSPDGNHEDLASNCSIPHVSYNPQVHVHAKPPYSFSSLIFMAIESSPNKALPVKDIYAWITENFPYYQSSPSGWKNTVRHNLSLNKCFKKLDKSKNDYVPIVGKGSLWCIDPELRPNLLQAVRRSPANSYPYMSVAKNNIISSDSNDAASDSRDQGSKKTPLSHLSSSQFFGKRLVISMMNRESEEAAAAESMLTLTRFSSDENVIIIDEKSEIISEEYLSSSTSAASSSEATELKPTVTCLNPTGDHNYFNQSEEQSNEMVNAQNLEDLEIEVTNGESEKTVVIGTVITSGKVSESPIVVKRKADEEDDGLKGAQALLNLAARNREPNPSDSSKTAKTSKRPRKFLTSSRISR